MMRACEFEGLYLLKPTKKANSLPFCLKKICSIFNFISEMVSSYFIPELKQWNLILQTIHIPNNKIKCIHGAFQDQ